MSKKAKAPFFSSLSAKIDGALHSPPLATKRQQEIDAALVKKGLESRSYREIPFGQDGLGQEVRSLALSIIPGLIKVVTNFGRLAQTGAELIPIPFIPAWAVGDVIGVVRAMEAFENKRPLEGFLCMAVALIPLMPTGPSQSIIFDTMTQRFITHALKAPKER